MSEYGYSNHFCVRDSFSMLGLVAICCDVRYIINFSESCAILGGIYGIRSGLITMLKNYVVVRFILVLPVIKMLLSHAL